MSVRFLTLATGSKGNCSLLVTPHAQVLIDCGIGIRAIQRLLGGIGLDWRALDAVFISHTHSDHIKGLPVLLKHVPLRVYCHQQHVAELRGYIASAGGTAEGATLFSSGARPRLTRHAPHIDIAGFQSDEGFHHRDIDVLPLAVSHDCEPTVGFKLFAAGRRIGTLTDLGCIDPRLSLAFGDCDVLLLEANHCPVMLKNGPYPEYLKRRIRGQLGHLSNEQSAQFAAGLAQWPRHLVLGHLSDNNNRPAAVELAYTAVVNGGRTAGQPPHTILTQLTAGPLLEL